VQLASRLAELASGFLVSALEPAELREVEAAVMVMVAAAALPSLVRT